jgi:hypothetical protein
MGWGQPQSLAHIFQPISKMGFHARDITPLPALDCDNLHSLLKIVTVSLAQAHDL